MNSIYLSRRKRIGHVSREDYADKSVYHGERWSIRKVAAWVVVWGVLYALGVVAMHIQ